MNGLRLCISSTLLAVSFGAVADVYTVTNNSGSVIPGSFREAVQLANANPGLDEIEFGLPPSSSPIINLLDPVLVTGPVIIDGSTQSGFAGTPAIRLIAPPAPTVDMNGPGVIRLEPGSDGSVISDLSFTAPEETNYLEATSDLIILNSAFNLVYNCRIGVDFVPTILPIRGVTTVDIGNTIAHCIVGKCNYGIAIGVADGTWVVDNAIGTDFSGSQDHGCIGAGIIVIRSADVIIGPIGNEPGNIIANNGDWAIISAWPPLADDYSNVSVRKNRIYNHSDIPFKIGVDGSNIIHPNDPGDHDFVNQTGPQNHAILNVAGRGDGQFTIIGSVDSTPNTSFIIDFFC